MNRSDAQCLKRSLEGLLSPIERLQILTDIDNDVPESEIKRRYSDVEKSFQYLCTCGFVYKQQDRYELSEIGEAFIDNLNILQDIAERRQKFEPLFEADPTWPTILPPTTVLQAGTVIADHTYSSGTEMEYLDFLDGSSTIRILNPLPDYYRAILNGLSGSDDALLQNVDDTTIEILVQEDSDYFEKVTDIIAQYVISPRKLDYQVVNSEFPYVLTVTDDGIGIWIHRSLGADRSVFIRGEADELREWATGIYRSAKNGT